ncbi:hypothetical protein JCM5353_002133, partial [Sporobolomyces roseus]
MCTAEATFFYGVFVQAAYLCFASDSFKANKKSLFAIDLICSRRRKGHLSTDGSATAILSVPYEVWEMIKSQVIDFGMRKAEKSMLKKYFGEDDREDHLALTSWGAIDSGDYGLDGFYEDSGAREMLKDRKSDLQRVLATFGLALPFDCPYSKEEYPQYDPFALSAISLPLRKTGSSLTSRTFPVPECDSPVEGGTAHAAAQFTEDSFKLPSDAKRRIQNFLSFFRLEPINPASDTF